MLSQSSSPSSTPRSPSAFKPRRPHTKTRTGCRTCRRRKVKCDETRPTCKNCQRRGLGAECEYAEVIHRMVPSRVGSYMQPQSHIQRARGPTHAVGRRLPDGEGILNAPVPVTSVTMGCSTPLGTNTFFLPSIPQNQQLNSKACTGACPPITSTYATAGTTIPIESPDRSRASSCNSYSPTSQHSSTNLHTPIQTPTLSSLPPQLPHPGDLTTCTLVHLFTTLTSLSCSTRPAVQRVYSIHVPRQALRLARTRPEEMGFLLCSMLAISALHAADLASRKKKKGREKDLVALRRKWVTIADVYHTLTLERFRVAVAKYAGGLSVRACPPGDVEKWTRLTWEDLAKGYEIEGLESGREDGNTDRTVPASGKEIKKGDGVGQVDKMGKDGPVARAQKRAQEPNRAADIFSQLSRDRVDELEAILLASAFLTIYDIASGNLHAVTSTSTDIITTTTSPLSSLSTTGVHSSAATSSPAVSCSTESTSVATLSTPPRRHMLSWIPLIRGTPALTRLSPLGWLIFFQGHLSPLTAGLNKQLLHNHPYEARITHLCQQLFTPAYIPHPNLLQPSYPLTEETFQKTIERLVECFARFFGGGDFLAVSMTFPASMEEEFFMALSIGEGEDEVGLHVPQRGGRRGGTKDPRALVIMAYVLILYVLVAGLFLEGEREVNVGEDVCGVLGVDWMDLDHDEESDEESDHDAGDGHCSTTAASNLADSIHKCPRHAASSPRWWLSGLGAREIKSIARYLQALDDEEAQTRGIEMMEGRWAKWMKWPLEIVKNGDKDVIGILKEAGRKATSMEG